MPISTGRRAWSPLPQQCSLDPPSRLRKQSRRTILARSRAFNRLVTATAMESYAIFDGDGAYAEW